MKKILRGTVQPRCGICGCKIIHSNKSPTPACIDYLKDKIRQLEADLRDERSKPVDFIMLKNSQGLS